MYVNETADADSTGRLPTADGGTDHRLQSATEHDSEAANHIVPRDVAPQ